MRVLSLCLVLGSFIALVACGSEPLSMEGIEEADVGIVGGSVYTGLPAVGAITVDGDSYCTGTLIGPRKVLTAAHCLEEVSASQMRFVIGRSLAAAEHTLRVSSITPHPSYNSSTITNDIGLVTLSADAPIDPLAINPSMSSSWVGDRLFFVGYGVTSASTNYGAGTKRAVWMDVSAVESKTFEYEDAGRNTCFGDSGGPAFFKDGDGNYLVAGVTSYGDEDCAQYGVDTRVDAYRSFIGEVGADAAESDDTAADSDSATDSGTAAAEVTVEGVTFTAAQVTAVLELVNEASADELDDDVGLDSRAAANIVAERPIASIEELAAISYVGASALEKLRDYVD